MNALDYKTRARPKCFDCQFKDLRHKSLSSFVDDYAYCRCRMGKPLPYGHGFITYEDICRDCRNELRDMYHAKMASLKSPKRSTIRCLQCRSFLLDKYLVRWHCVWCGREMRERDGIVREDGRS